MDLNVYLLMDLLSTSVDFFELLSTLNKLVGVVFLICFSVRFLSDFYSFYSIYCLLALVVENRQVVFPISDYRLPMSLSGLSLITLYFMSVCKGEI